MADNYTKQWPFNETKSESLVSELSEARGFFYTLTGLNKYSYKTLCEMLYLTLVSMAMLVQERQSHKAIAQYADEALVYKNFNKAYTRLNDVALMCATVLGNNPKYKYNNETTKHSQRHLIDYFKMLRGDMPVTKSKLSFYLFSFESMLLISDKKIKRLRRKVIQLAEITPVQRVYAYKDAKMLLRRYNPRLEILPYFDPLIPAKMQDAGTTVDTLSAVALAALTGSQVGRQKRRD